MSTSTAVVIVSPTTDDDARAHTTVSLLDLLVARQPEIAWSVGHTPTTPSQIGADCHVIIIGNIASSACQEQVRTALATLTSQQPASLVVVSQPCCADLAHQHHATYIDASKLTADHPGAKLVVLERIARHIVGEDFLPRLGNPEYPASDDRGHWLFIGDSITDSGRDDASQPLGNGYVNFLHELILARRPDIACRFTNRGVSGNTVNDLAARWDSDCRGHDLQRLIVKVGINDCHRFVRNQQADCAPDAFDHAYRDLLERTRAQLGDSEILLVNPFYLSDDIAPGSEAEQVLSQLEAYQDHVRTLADDYDCRFLDMHARLRAHSQYRGHAQLAPDRVHPSSTGCMIIAEAIYDTVIGDH